MRPSSRRTGTETVSERRGVAEHRAEPVAESEMVGRLAELVESGVQGLAAGCDLGRRR